MAVPSQSVSRQGRSAPSSTPAAQVTVTHVEKAAATFTVPSSTRATVTREAPAGTGTDTGDDAQLTEISSFDQLGPKPTRIVAGGGALHSSSAQETQGCGSPGAGEGGLGSLSVGRRHPSSSSTDVFRLA